MPETTKLFTVIKLSLYFPYAACNTVGMGDEIVQLPNDSNLWTDLVRPPKTVAGIIESRDAQLLHELLKLDPMITERFHQLVTTNNTDVRASLLNSWDKYGVGEAMLKRFVAIAQQDDWQSARQRMDEDDARRQQLRRERHGRIHDEDRFSHLGY